jgi:hypothetical protein
VPPTSEEIHLKWRGDGAGGGALTRVGLKLDSLYVDSTWITKISVMKVGLLLLLILDHFPLLVEPPGRISLVQCQLLKRFTDCNEIWYARCYS